MTNANAERYWRATSKLMWTALVIWALFSFVVHIFVVPLNSFVYFGFPLGFWFAAQGSLIVFVGLLFVFAAVQNAIDRYYGSRKED